MASPCGFESHLSHQKSGYPFGVAGFFSTEMGLEQFNAIVLWTIARRVGPRRHLYFCLRQKCKRVPSLAPKKRGYQRYPLFFGARDGTRTHTAKPHAPQTCLSTIPTLSQVLMYYNCLVHFCQYLFPKPLRRIRSSVTLKKINGGMEIWYVFLYLRMNCREIPSL